MSYNAKESFASLSMWMLIISGGATVLFTLLDYALGSSVAARHLGPPGALMTIVVFGMFILGHYLIIAARPSRARWVYFWFIALLIVSVTYYAINADLSDPQSPSGTDMVMIAVGWVVFSAPLVYFRLYDPGFKRRR